MNAMALLLLVVEVEIGRSSDIESIAVLLDIIDNGGAIFTSALGSLESGNH